MSKLEHRTANENSIYKKERISKPTTENSNQGYVENQPLMMNDVACQL